MLGLFLRILQEILFCSGMRRINVQSIFCFGNPQFSGSCHAEETRKGGKIFPAANSMVMLLFWEAEKVAAAGT